MKLINQGNNNPGKDHNPDNNNNNNDNDKDDQGKKRTDKDNEFGWKGKKCSIFCCRFSRISGGFSIHPSCRGVVK